MRTLLPVALLAAMLTGCIELDFFLFDPLKADSIAGDYHGLPLWSGDDPPPWIADTPVEREIYLHVPSAAVISPNALADSKPYIHGVFIPAPATCEVEQCPLIEDPPTIIYQHGNSGHMWRYWWRAVALWNLGANVFIYTYRGYGLSSGEPSKAKVLEDADTAMQYLSSRPDVNPARIVAYGYSMGGVSTSYLVGKSAHKGKFTAAIIESPLDTPASIVKQSTGTDFPGGFFLDEDSPFDGAKFIEGSALPILHFHGADDDVISLDQAERYYQVLKDRPDYTHYLGKTDAPDEAWIETCNHRNLPAWTFDANKHIADYWGHDKNPTNCCVHPLEFLDADHGGFLNEVGHTNGDELLAAARDYKRLLHTWLQSVLP